MPYDDKEVKRRKSLWFNCDTYKASVFRCGLEYERIRDIFRLLHYYADGTYKYDHA